MAEIKQLKDLVLNKFLDGEMLVIQGFDIMVEDLRIMYSFSGEESKGLSEKYEADSVGDNLVMLNTTPDEEMLQERVTREVDQQGAEAQKVSKMDDKVTMYYTITAKANNLAMIIFIQTSSKTVVRPLSSLPTKLQLRISCFS